MNSTRPGWTLRAAFVTLMALFTGCGLLSTPRLHVTIFNHTEAPVRVQMVEFDFVSGEFGAALGGARDLAGGERLTVQLPIPGVQNWALQVNGIPGVTSVGLAEAERGIPGEEPLWYVIGVYEGGLETQVTRSAVSGGSTSAPAPD